MAETLVCSFVFPFIFGRVNISQLPATIHQKPDKIWLRDWVVGLAKNRAPAVAGRGGVFGGGVGEEARLTWNDFWRVKNGGLAMRRRAKATFPTVHWILQNDE
jgi:hypothetical protein